MIDNLDSQELMLILEFLMEFTVEKTTRVALNEYTCEDVYAVYKTWCLDNAFNFVEITKFNDYLKLKGKGGVIILSNEKEYYADFELNEYAEKEYGDILPKIYESKDSTLVTIYIHCSNDELYNDEQQLGDQITAIYEYCLNKKYTIDAVYCDVGDENCYQHYELLDGIHNGDVTKLIALNPDRIYKGFREDMLTLREAILFEGVILEFIDNSIKFQI